MRGGYTAGDWVGVTYLGTGETKAAAEDVSTEEANIDR